MDYEMQLLINRVILDHKYIEIILKNIHIGESSLCIDVGCGPGVSTRFISDYLFKTNIIGIDNSESAINVARKYNCSKYVDFICADAQSLPFENNSIDLCFSRMLLDIVPKLAIFSFVFIALSLIGLLINPKFWISGVPFLISFVYAVISAIMLSQFIKQ